MFRAVIFDMDGLLIDSERIIRDAMIFAARKMGVSGMEEATLLTLGVTKDITEKIFRERFGDDFDFERCNKYKHEYLDKTLPDKFFPPKAYARESVRRLKDMGLLTALATSTRRERAEPPMEHLGLLSEFDAAVYGDLLTVSKPDPAIFLLAAENLGVSPQECFILEDSYNGIRAAAAAGSFPIMIPDLLPPDDEMKRLAGYIAGDLEKAADYIADNI